MSHTFSYWEQDSFLKSWDLIVIGAGIVGLSAAHFYLNSRPEARVLVLEKGFIPEGASTRNAGFACVGSIGEHLADLKKSSEEEVRQRIKRRYDGLQLLRGTLGDEDIGYEACGGYELFTEEKSFEWTEAHIAQFNDWMAELTGQQKVYRASRQNGYPVIHNRLEGALHPGRMMTHLVRTVSGQGAEIKWNSRVESVEEDGTVTVEKGISLKSRQVLVAANGFVRKLLPGVEVTPARGYVFVSEPLDEMPWRGTFHHDEGYIYFRNVGNRLLLGGARNVDPESETTDDFGSNPVIRQRLKDFARDTLKLGNGWKTDYEWSGIMGFTETKTPVVESVDEVRTVAAGLSGMGIAIGMETGKRAAGLLSHK